MPSTLTAIGVPSNTWHGLDHFGSTDNGESSFTRTHSPGKASGGAAEMGGSAIWTCLEIDNNTYARLCKYWVIFFSPTLLTCNQATKGHP